MTNHGEDQAEAGRGRDDKPSHHIMAPLRPPRNPTSRPRKPDSWRCRKHPKHQQPPGVCSLCLREKLSRLSSGGSSSSSSFTSRSTGLRFDHGAKNSSCSSSLGISLYESSSPSATSLSSPEHRFKRCSGLFGWNKDALAKSRSIAFIPRGRGKEGGQGKISKFGFWSRLIPRRGRKTGSGKGLQRSEALREGSR